MRSRTVSTLTAFDPIAGVGRLARCWVLGRPRSCIVVAEFGDARTQPMSQLTCIPRCSYCQHTTPHPFVATIDARTGVVAVTCQKVLAGT